MLTAHQFLHPDHSAINLAGIIINIVKKKNIIKQTDLLKKVAVITRENPECMLAFALDLLYLMGEIEYSDSHDTIKYLK